MSAKVEDESGDRERPCQCASITAEGTGSRPAADRNPAGEHRLRTRTSVHDSMTRGTMRLTLLLLLLLLGRWRKVGVSNALTGVGGVLGLLSRGRSTVSSSHRTLRGIPTIPTPSAPLREHSQMRLTSWKPHAKEGSSLHSHRDEDLQPVRLRSKAQLLQRGQRGSQRQEPSQRSLQAQP